MSIAVAIVDDEPLARSRLRRLLEKVAGPEIAIVADCINADELAEVGSRHALDAIFLDIQMPGASGFDALANWKGPPPLVVFVTAFEQHGARAFDARAVDYLLKPVSAERLAQCIAQLKERLALKHLPADNMSANSARRIPLQVGQRVQLVPEDRINVIQAQGNYLDIDTEQGLYTLRRTLGSFETELDPALFVRVHRSTLVRRDAIREVMPLGSARYRIDLYTGRRIVSGRSYRAQVQALLNHRPA
ncbi:MAG: LytTR family DNA-binding domain-containing protein [Pseudoxanthomonas sp.]